MNTVRQKLDIPAQNEVLQDEVTIRSASELDEFQASDTSVDAPSVSTTWEMRLDPDSGPATIPATCVEAVVPVNGTSSAVQRPDCISQGVLTVSQAQTCFETYAYRLDHFLYRILGESPSLEHIRSSSPLLTAAICAVGALHSQDLSHIFEKIQKAFLNQCASLLFSKSSNIDDIRGLCIGAFWLHDVSWQLVGLGLYSPLHSYHLLMS
jgi:hypothetical protein